MKLYNMDCLKYLETCEPVKCIFMDPPDNIGLKYASYSDNLDSTTYFRWLESVINAALHKCDILWVSYNQKYDLQMSGMLPSLLTRRGVLWKCRKIIWYFTFGLYTGDDYTASFRPILRISNPNATYYPGAYRVTSERMRKGDSRAAGPKIPNDVWEVPRVAPGHPDRRDWHPTQHPADIYSRIIKYSCLPVEAFVDLFAGSGSCFSAGRSVNHGNMVGVELDPYYCNKIPETFPFVSLVTNT